MYSLSLFMHIFLVEKISAKILFEEKNDKYEVRVTVVTVEDPGEMFHRVTFLPQLNIEC